MLRSTALPSTHPFVRHRHTNHSTPPTRITLSPPHTPVHPVPPQRALEAEESLRASENAAREAHDAARAAAARAEEAESRHAFLESLNARLNAELASVLSRRGWDADRGAGGDPHPALSEGPLPPWLTDPEALPPLLEAYDRRVRELEAALGDAEERAVAAEGRVAAEVEGARRETEELRGRMGAELRALQRKAEEWGAAGGGGGEGGERVRRLVERIELLGREVRERRGGGERGGK